MKLASQIKNLLEGRGLNEIKKVLDKDLVQKIIDKHFKGKKIKQDRTENTIVLSGMDVKAASNDLKVLTKLGLSAGLGAGKGSNGSIIVNITRSRKGFL